MRGLAISLALLSCCGCARTVDTIINRHLMSHCEVREGPMAPGTRYIDHDNAPRRWVEIGADGSSHPIPTPPGKEGTD